MFFPVLKSECSDYVSSSFIYIDNYSTIKIGTLTVSNIFVDGYGETSSFAIYDKSDTNFTTPIYIKGAGTSLSNIEIDISAYEGVVLRFRHSRNYSDGKNMTITLTNVEIS